MTDHFYFKNHRLFHTPFTLLLAYHCPLGNPVRLWTSRYMISHILAVRKDLYILDLALTVIQLRKALNATYNKVISRGTILMYAESHEAIKFGNNSVFIFVTSWIPGLITNYAQTMKSISVSVKKQRFYAGLTLTRPQQDAMFALNKTETSATLLKLYPKRRTRFPRIPSISFAVSDNPIWLNECRHLGIPSISICDTLSFYDRIDFPIIANQRSFPFTGLLINLFAEVCINALMSEYRYRCIAAYIKDILSVTLFFVKESLRKCVNF
jgi:ribosomal protein S2